MSNFLKQATASQSRSIGPFLDDTDFKTAETGLTIANTDIKLVINGAASANKNSGGGTHRINGVYGVTFDATDTATCGEIEVSVAVAGALPVFKTYVVVEEVVYDMLFGASAIGYIANQPVDLNTIKTQAVTCAAGVTVPTTLASTTNITAAAGVTLSPTGSAAMTEGYPTDGSTGTLAQLLYLMLAFLQEKNVSGTTVTTKKLDGSTTAATYTLDSATVPTTITRAT